MVRFGSLCAVRDAARAGSPRQGAKALLFVARLDGVMDAPRVPDIAAREVVEAPARLPANDQSVRAGGTGSGWWLAKWT